MGFIKCLRSVFKLNSDSEHQDVRNYGTSFVNYSRFLNE